jgi:hypothetical protein
LHETSIRLDGKRRFHAPLLYLDGQDLAGLPLVERKRRLDE